MVWKSGKSGIHTGRTVRSRFAHKTRSRREGLLIHSSSDENKEKSDLLTYSLGKQNRWLLPEVIKTNSVEIDKEVVLVERFSSEGSKKHRRADCFSVYSPESSTTHRPKRRFSHAKNLLRHGEHAKSRYEVAYPYPAGLWPAGRELGRQKVGTNFGHRKKNSNVWFTLEEETDDNTEEIEDMNNDNECDFPDQWGFYKARPSTFDLMDWMTSHGIRKLPESRNINTLTDSRKRVENCKEQELRKGKCIYIGTDNEMYDVHLELLAQIKETSSALIATEQDNVDSHPVRNKVRRRARRWRWRRKRWSRRFQNRDSADNYAEPSSLQIGVSEPVVRDTKGFTIALCHQDVSPETLEQQWGNLYKEGSCLPRTFALDVTPLVSHHTNVTEEFLVLFQLVENQPGFASNKVKAFVSIVTCHDETISETMWSKLVSHMKANNVGQEMWSVKDVMDIVLAWFSSENAGLRTGKADYSEPRKPKQSLCILNELLGWNSKNFSAMAARKEMKKLLAKDQTSNQLDHASCSSVDMQFQQHTDCGICFEELQDADLDGLPDYTALMDCGHTFCNECWKTYLETQIHSGQLVLRCPGHGCRTLIDDVTLVFLVPSWYSRHIERKLDSLMETSPDWKWCPADRCKLVAKTTALQYTSTVQEVPGTMIQPVPVICSCGNMWCFKCQEDAHWPATCDEARVFRQKNEGYAKMLSTDRTRLITSVDVKNCPFCHYPIEKDQGCEHMVCSMCYKEFCWLCLREWGYPHFCKHSPLIKQRHVELPIYTKHFRTHEHVAATSRISRSPGVILNIHRKLDQLVQGLKNYELFSSLKKDCNHNSCVSRLLNSLSETNAVQHLREAFNFKFQALLVLEGAAIRLSLSKKSGNKFALEFDRLLFIVERMDEVLQNFSESCRTRSLQKLAHFVMCGKKCIIALGRSREICN